MQVKGLRWEEFRRVASCVRMFHQLVQIYLIEDNQAKQAVGEADLRPLGSYEDLAHVLHFEWARYMGKYPSPNVVDIGSSWPGYEITLFGWEAPISTAMVWEEFKYELCFIRVKMMDGGPSEDEEKNMQTAVRTEEEGVSIYLALPFPSPSQGKQISEVGQVHVFGLASYEDLARALHEAWVRYTGGNARPNVVDVEKSWPGYRVTLYALDDSGLCNHPIDIADMDWVEFTERLDSIQVEPVAAVGSSAGTSGSVGDKFEDHGENEDGGRNGGCGDMNNCG
ncbi:hypothetical protein ACJRO7_025023 [Eucalyptus globulus]|uniref:Uncharacterized protein n=1 Tax=Eucalyptus globulus TaxID=34317 RepID=A0ABD3K7V4_EUCGL